MTAATAPRRELLLEAAAELFAERGYHAVGIDDLGAAAGITGPGVYRHFPSKQAVLAALCDRAMTTLLDRARRARTESADPGEALESLLDLHVGFAVRQRALLSVWVREQRALEDDVRRSLRRRQRAYEQPWREVVASLREDLDEDEVAVAVRSVLTMLNSTVILPAQLDEDRQALLLRRMALAALLTRRAPRR